MFADKNVNGQQDPGEAISGGWVNIVGDVTTWHETMTDAEGNFAFSDLPPGTYHANYRLEDGWVVHHAKTSGDQFTITAGATTKITARAERSYAEQIKATATLDSDSYRLPATATIMLNLTNTTNRRINGIKASCDSRIAPEALGRGKGWDGLVANGLSLEPGQKYSAKIEEEIPEAASKDGKVTLDCAFAPNPGWNTDGARVHAEAKVSGGVGTYTLVLGEDRNSDSRIEGDEATENVKVVLLDARTGEQVAERTSGEDGKVEFSGFKIGEYRVVAVGSWAFTDPAQQRVHITAQGGFAYGFLKFARPAELRVTAKVDKPRYESHETVRLELTVTNIGGQTAERSRVDWSPWGLDIKDADWGEFAPRGPGILIPAGESRTFSVSAKIKNLENGKLTIWGGVDYIGRPNPHKSGYYFQVDVVQTTGTVTGVVYTDKNANGQLDPGEAAPDAIVEANGGAPYGYVKTTTDANGRFTFENVPSGEYWIGYTLAGGWVVHVEGDLPTFRVQPGAPVQLSGRADRPYSELLNATMVLDRASYTVGEEAKITIRLTNVSDREIRGVQAGCNRIGDPNHFGGYDGPMPEGWGDLRYGTPGITLGPREAKTIVATEKVPAAARWRQSVIAACDFEPFVAYNVDGPYVLAQASVPGGSGLLKGRLAQDRDKNDVVDKGEALAGTRVLLMTDKENGYQLAEATSDADGNVRFDQVPPGVFWATVDGPWKFEGDGGQVDMRPDQVVQRDFFVVADPRATPPPADQRPGGSTGGALAKTGASVLGLGLVAALLVAFGFGARIAGRRRTV